MADPRWGWRCFFVIWYHNVWMHYTPHKFHFFIVWILFEIQIVLPKFGVFQLIFMNFSLKLLITMKSFQYLSFFSIFIFFLIFSNQNWRFSDISEQFRNPRLRIQDDGFFKCMTSLWRDMTSWLSSDCH